MRIGLSGGGSSVDKSWSRHNGRSPTLHLAVASQLPPGHPLVATAIAGRATTTIELGAGVLQTYPRR